MWMCVVHEHNDVCKQNEHGRRLSVESRIGVLWNIIDGQVFGFFTKIFIYPKSTIRFVSNFN